VKVFVLMYEEYEDATVVGVFATFEGAMQALPADLRRDAIPDFWESGEESARMNIPEDWPRPPDFFGGYVVGIAIEAHEVQP
jgi:hypothetical protein